MTKGVRIRIEGRVQGVHFRESTRREAERLDVSGWVRNTPDGAVEGQFHGPTDGVDALIDWCHHGPPNARVDAVIVQSSSDAFRGFEVRRTTKD